MQTNQAKWMVAAALFGSLVPVTALADGSGTRVVITVPADSEGSVPAPEALIEKLKTGGAQAPLQAMVHKAAQNGLAETKLELWGNILPAAQIEPTLRAAFPSLAGAQIAVTTLDPGQRPPAPEECKDMKPGQKCKIVKKEEHGS
jgi:hypothetical protein